MTSLHVICGLGPPIKNPGYAYEMLKRLFFLLQLRYYALTAEVFGAFIDTLSHFLAFHRRSVVFSATS